MTRINFRGKLFEKLSAQLEKNNKAFEKLGRRDQRIAIAKDVISLLKAEKIQPASTYLNIQSEHIQDCYDNNGHPLDKLDEIQAGVILEQLPSCKVCGIGSLFVAAIRKHDKMTFNDLLADYEACDTRDMQTDYLKRWFDSDELDSVEEYFEQENDEYITPENSPIKAEYDKSKRLVMIMENIISNKGHFKPSKGSHRDVESED
jgi:hypothetical protein